MEPQFWHERWQQNQIGFHQGDINPYLIRYLPKLELPAGSTVFVPLCGKSRDLLWLVEQGMQVVGVELSPIAVETFFREAGMSHEKIQQGALERWQADGVTIFCGDFFQLGADDLGEVSAVYDHRWLHCRPPCGESTYSILGTYCQPIHRDS
jgi:thiopurine S-methyltransferase